MWPEGDSVSEDEEFARRGGRGRKLQAEFGRFATSVKISDMRRCCIDVSYRNSAWLLVEKTQIVKETTYKLGIELCQSGLA